MTHTPGSPNLLTKESLKVVRVNGAKLRQKWYEAHHKWRFYMRRNFPNFMYLDAITDGDDDTIGRALRIAFDLFYLDDEEAADNEGWE